MNKSLMQFFLTLLILFAGSFCCPLLAQDYEKLYKRGLHAFYAEDFPAAAYFFEEIAATGKHHRDSKYFLEICQLLMDRERPLDVMLSYRETKGTYDKFYYYWLGRIFTHRYMFPEAVDVWERFLSKKAFKSDEIESETRDFIAEVQKLVSYFDNTDNYEIHQLEPPVNSPFAELSPAYFESGYELIFASNRNSEKADNFNVFHSANHGPAWTLPTQVMSLGAFKRKEVNLEVIDEDGKLFLYEKVKGGDLFYSEKESEGWTAPREFDHEITSTHMESHFYLSAQEDRLIFSTKNRKNKLDLVESYKDPTTGEWTDPVPFSSNIDTEYNEDCPYLTSDGNTLYFCSDRPGGVGGYDVYITTWDPATRRWSDPENMGWPINSPDDELHFKFNHDMHSGYFSSDRIHSLGDFDLFFFWEVEKTTVEGKVVDAVTGLPFQKGEIRFHPSLYKDEYFRSTLDSAGRYKTNIISDEIFSVEVTYDMDTLLREQYEVHESRGQHVNHVQDFYILPKDMPEDKKVALKKKLYATNEQNRLLAEASGPTSGAADLPEISLEAAAGGNIVLQTVYFEYGTGNLTPESTPTLLKLFEFLEGAPDVKIEIEGHTDDAGHPMKNLAISKRRAIAVKNWLVVRGIAEDRMQSAGYGANKPIASNEQEEGRALNRRIEVRVIQ